MALSDVLALAGVRPDARHIGFEGADISPEAHPSQRFGGSIGVEKATRLTGSPMPGPMH